MYFSVFILIPSFVDREIGTFTFVKYWATAQLSTILDRAMFHLGYIIVIDITVLRFILVFICKFAFIVSNILAYFILKLKLNIDIFGNSMMILVFSGTIFVLNLIIGEKRYVYLSGICWAVFFWYDCRIGLLYYTCCFGDCSVCMLTSMLFGLRYVCQRTVKH